jgi:DNA-binding transcriptional ArsR family regulator
LTSDYGYIIIIDNNNILTQEKYLMTQKKADLILHPVRLQILQTLPEAPLTTQEIADRLPNVPASSIYRHLKKLLESGLIQVAESRPVRGVQEKVYRLSQPPHLSAADMAAASKEDHLRYFTTYVATLLQGFTNYLDQIDSLDLIRDRTGYTEVTFYSSPGEFDQIQMALNQSLLPHLRNSPREGRVRRKLAVITHPLPGPGESDPTNPSGESYV